MAALLVSGVEDLVCSAAAAAADLAVILIPHPFIIAKLYYTIRISLHTVSSCIMALYRM